MVGRFHVEELEKNPNVEKVTMFQLTLTKEFRIQLFLEWKKELSTGMVAYMLEQNGITEELTGKNFASSVVKGFQTNGFPCYSVNETQEAPNYTEKNPLLLSGRFVRFGRGIQFTSELTDELYFTWPEVSIEDGLRRAGIDPIDVGHQKIQLLRRNFIDRSAGKSERKECRTADQPQKAVQLRGGLAGNEMECPDAGGSEKSGDTEAAWENPYVRVADGKVELRNAFFNETYLIAKKPMEEILRAYRIDIEWVNATERSRLHAKLYYWKPTPDSVKWDSREVLEIQRKRAALMDAALLEGFRRMKGYLEGVDITMRRKYCKWVYDLPRDPWGYYTTGRILESSGMARSTYYRILSDENYGYRMRQREEQDEEDIALIRQVLDYRGFKKGIRQVYMMMPDITGKQFSIHRIRRLMNRYGIRTNIRKPSKNRKAMRDMFERNQKANLLMRRFKQHRPNEVRLTDVTYLDYGDGLRAYGSASLDPVTGKLVCFVVSASNDLQLALDTLTELDAEHLPSNVILHSDQGILYMTDEFQKVARQLGLVQSMSRRGNCWDNAPQESFFGHFKDECPYKECKTLEELRDKIGQYRVYYNEERRMWERNRMTPLEFEAWLLAMDEAAFAGYLAEEEARFQARKEESTRQAVERARIYKNMGKTEDRTDETCSKEQI